jgi:hypothetical protein
VRQQIYRTFNATPGFFLRDLRGESIHGVHRRMEHSEFLAVLHRSKFCLAPAGMGFSTRVYESIAQGCVPLIIQHEPDSDTEADQAFEDLLPYQNFSLRLRQDAIPMLPSILADFPKERWLALRRNLGCVWPRIMWLRAQKPPALGGSAAARGAESTELEEFDAWETMMASLARKAARRRGEAPPPFRWWSESHSCPL